MFNGNGPLTLNFNLIVGNTASGDPSSSGFRNSSGATTIENDWWGCNQGPAVSPCDRASGPTGFGILQWLVLNHKATPNTILVNTSTTLQADFFTNNAGSLILPTGLVALEGRPILFNNAVIMRCWELFQAPTPKSPAAKRMLLSLRVQPAAPEVPMLPSTMPR